MSILKRIRLFSIVVTFILGLYLTFLTEGKVVGLFFLAVSIGAYFIYDYLLNRTKFTLTNRIILPIGIVIVTIIFIFSELREEKELLVVVSSAFSLIIGAFLFVLKLRRN